MIKVGREADGISVARTKLVRRACVLLSALAATLAVTMAGPGSETGLSPRPAEAAPAVKVAVRCDSNPEAVPSPTTPGARSPSGRSAPSTSRARRSRTG